MQSDGMPILICVLALFAGLVASQKICPDGSLCNTGDTCCKLRSGQYTCCPLPNAVCCKDQEHCCPYGYRCDNETDACKPPREHAAHAEALLAHPLGVGKNWQRRNDYVPCGLPDDPVCPADHTCCTTAPNSIATNHSCCPFRNAVCCADGEHCCPSQTTCHSTTRRCSHDAPGAMEKPQRTVRMTAVKAVNAECQGGLCAASSSRYTVRGCPPGYYQCSNPVYCCPDDFLCTFTGACVPKPRFATRTVAVQQYGD